MKVKITTIQGVRTLNVSKLLFVIGFFIRSATTFLGVSILNTWRCRHVFRVRLQTENPWIDVLNRIL